MTAARDEFWTLLEASRDPQGDTFETAENLREALERRGLDEVKAWTAELGRVLEESYTLPLRGALHVVYGGCSDDHFEAFRGWLLAQGRATFEGVVAAPDTLVDVLVEGEMAESEQMLYVGALAIEALSGEFPDGPTFVAEAGEGDFDPTDLGEQQRRYPRLWAKYAHMPRPREAPPEDD